MYCEREMLGVQDEIVGTGVDRWGVHFLDRFGRDTRSLGQEIRVFDELVASPEMGRGVTPRGELLVPARRGRTFPVEGQQVEFQMRAFGGDEKFPVSAGPQAR